LCDGVVRLRYRCGFETEQPVTPGEVYEVEVVMWDTCAGRRGAPAAGRGRVVGVPEVRRQPRHRRRQATETDGVIARNRLWHTSARPSRLIVN
jgi:predicted acyl esterase